MVVLYIGISHRSSFLFLVPSSTILLSLSTVSFFLERITRQSPLQSCPMDMREELLSSGSIIALVASGESFSSMGTRPVPYASRTVLSG